MICANCGREMPDTVRFCGICGTPNPLSENAVPVQERADAETSELSAGESMTDTRTAAMPAQEYAADTTTEERPAQKHTAGIQSSIAHLNERTPYTQTDGTSASEYSAYISAEATPSEHRAYASAEATSSEYRAYTPADTTPPRKKEKRTCPLSVVVFCGVVIFFLSVACGVLAGLYLNARSALSSAPYSLTEYREG